MFSGSVLTFVPSCCRLLSLREAPSVRRVVLRERRRRRRRRRLWKCQLYPGPWQERPRTEARGGDCSALELWRGPLTSRTVQGPSRGLLTIAVTRSKHGSLRKLQMKLQLLEPLLLYLTNSTRQPILNAVL